MYYSTYWESLALILGSISRVYLISIATDSIPRSPSTGGPTELGFMWYSVFSPYSSSMRSPSSIILEMIGAGSINTSTFSVISSNDWNGVLFFRTPHYNNLITDHLFLSLKYRKSYVNKNNLFPIIQYRLSHF